MKEVFEIGKKVMFTAGKYMPKALIGISAGATVGGLILAVQAGIEFQKLKDSGKEITWKDYARIFGPCATAGVFAIACAFAGLTKQEQRYAAAAALASMYESKEKEIDAKVREVFGNNEAEKIHDSIAKDRLEKAPEPIVAYGGTAFLDVMTGQYIYMDIETIRARITNLNIRMAEGYDVTLGEWCDTFDEYSVTAADELGWNLKLTGKIEERFAYHTLASGRTVAALEVTEPKLFYEESEQDPDDEEYTEFLKMRNPGWSEV